MYLHTGTLINLNGAASKMKCLNGMKSQTNLTPGIDQHRSDPYYIGPKKRWSLADKARGRKLTEAEIIAAYTELTGYPPSTERLKLFGVNPNSN